MESDSMITDTVTRRLTGSAVALLVVIWRNSTIRTLLPAVATIMPARSNTESRALVYCGHAAHFPVTWPLSIPTSSV